MAIVAQLRERRRERELAILESGQPKSWGREPWKPRLAWHYSKAEPPGTHT